MHTFRFKLYYNIGHIEIMRLSSAYDPDDKSWNAPVIGANYLCRVKTGNRRYKYAYMQFINALNAYVTTIGVGTPNVHQLTITSKNPTEIESLLEWSDKLY